MDSKLVVDNNSTEKTDKGEIMRLPRDNFFPKNSRFRQKKEPNGSPTIKQYQNFPKKSEQSRNGGHTIYFASNGGEKNVNDNNNNNKKDVNINTSPIDIVDKKIIEQRSVEFNINKPKNNNLLSDSLKIKKENNNSTEKIKIPNNNNNNNSKIKINNIKVINKNFSLKDDKIKLIKIDSLNSKNNKRGKKVLLSYENNGNNNGNKILNENSLDSKKKSNAYKRKINIKQNIFNINEKIKKNNSRGELKTSRNDNLLKKKERKQQQRK